MAVTYPAGNLVTTGNTFMPKIPERVTIKPQDERTPEEAEELFRRTVKKMLQTPPRPHKPVMEQRRQPRKGKKDG
jgi:hypothetical protein